MRILKGIDYRKSSIKPPGCLFDLDTPGGLIREGGLFKKLDEKDIYDSFISLLQHILQIEYTILGVEYINSTEFCPKLYQT